MHKLFWKIVVLLALITLISCTDKKSDAENKVIRVKTGHWIGESDGGSYGLEFIVSNDAASIFIVTYSYPCGEQNIFVMSSKTLKTDIINNAFEMKVDQTNLYGKFIDKNHVEGTWEVFLHQIEYTETVCPAAKGTWKGGPD